MTENETKQTNTTKSSELPPLDTGEKQDDDSEAPVYERRESAAQNQLKRAIFSVPIEVVVTVGTARPLIGELLSMEKDHLLPLDTNLDDPVELRVKDRVIARGELTQTGDDQGRLGIRLTEIVDMSDII